MSKICTMYIGRQQNIDIFKELKSKNIWVSTVNFDKKYAFTVLIGLMDKISNNILFLLNISVFFFLIPSVALFCLKLKFQPHKGILVF